MHTPLRRLHKKLSKMAESPLHLGVIALAPIAIVAVMATSLPLIGQFQHVGVTKNVPSNNSTKASNPAPVTVTKPTNQVTTSTRDTTSSNQVSSSTPAVTKHASNSSTTKNTGVLTPLPGIPTVPTIKLDYVSGSGAHFIYIYSYHVRAATYEFIVHPVHSAHYTSDFYTSGYLNTAYSNPNSEPEQLTEGNPQLNSWFLADGDIYTLTVCTYDSGICGVKSSNTVTLTVSVKYEHGAVEDTYNYSK